MHINYPFIKIPILLQSDYASCIEWVVRIIDRLAYLAKEESIFQRYLLDIASTPADG